LGVAPPDSSHHRRSKAGQPSVNRSLPTPAESYIHFVKEHRSPQEGTAVGAAASTGGPGAVAPGVHRRKLVRAALGGTLAAGATLGLSSSTVQATPPPATADRRP